MGIEVFPEGEASPSPGLAGGTTAYPGFTPRKDGNPNGVVAWVPRLVRPDRMPFMPESPRALS
ncbi:hypothetical protein BH23VER1_BH23VER1_23330 [soil metagenome]